MIKLLLADDQDIVRRGLKALLKTESSFNIVGEAENGETAIAQIPLLHPDVILMDIRMPIMDGVAATEIISQQYPTIKVLVLTTFDDDEYVTQAIQNGAVGYLLKDTPPDDLIAAIQAVSKGYTQLAPGIARKLMQTSVATKPTPPPGWETLTRREQEILALIAKGANNKEIAQTLYIAEKTVKNHVTNILTRLNVRDRTQAAILAHSFLGHETDTP
ncbi:response regulator transcription factor [Spirulina sp. CS-785/01]|uniref:response regulator n=1 Tax=Spirulina sp. CS-785/01 TaxID=3021716 RepID=UPI00232D3D09|nr:response regulator transcription factor [Spirulina sp. CS-785/01]MDB9312620.1 response regulator transcription factor [Spirulina sp. CS-785/01]